MSNERIFFQRFSWADDGFQLVDPELVALGFADAGELAELGSLAPEQNQAYSTLVARGKRAFLSSYGTLEIVTSADDGPLHSKQHEIRSYQCSGGALEVTDDQAPCALNEFGVQAIPLD